MNRATLLGALLALAACTSVSCTSGPKPTPAPPPPVIEPNVPGPPAVAGFLGADFVAGSLIEIVDGYFVVLGITDFSPHRLGAILMKGKSELDSAKGEVFGDLSWQCDEASMMVKPVGNRVAFVVTCVNGADARESRETAIVLRAVKPDPATLHDIEVVWTGEQRWEKEAAGCAQGDGGRLEVRGAELWLVREPWAKGIGASPDPDCDAPPVADLQVRLDPPK